jgi:predicted nucleotidyltransferase component of viral defense system
MLQTKTVEPNTFSVLKKLMEIPELMQFSLVGGTALSLLYGHRMSVDLDLFSNKPFDNDELINLLETNFEGFSTRVKAMKFGIFGYINEIKVDIVRHPHILIRPINTVEGIRMFSTEDIIAMKVQAILGRGKKKDFWDIAELFKHYTVDDFINFHAQKYPNQFLMISIPQALIYFADADESEDPISLNKQTWAQIKNAINKKVSDYLM